MELGLSRRILFYWKKEYKWDKKRFDAEHNKDRFSEELLEFARKMMNKISADIDNNQKTPPPEIYSLINILKNIPLVKQNKNQPVAYRRILLGKLNEKFWEWNKQNVQI